MFPPDTDAALSAKAAAYRCAGSPVRPACGSSDVYPVDERAAAAGVFLAVRRYRCRSCGSTVSVGCPFDPPVGFDMRATHVYA